MSTFHNAEENKLKQFISHNKEVLHEKFNDNDIQELLSNFDDQFSVELLCTDMTAQTFFKKMEDQTSKRLQETFLNALKKNKNTGRLLQKQIDVLLNEMSDDVDHMDWKNSDQSTCCNQEKVSEEKKSSSETPKNDFAEPMEIDLVDENKKLENCQQQEQPTELIDKDKNQEDSKSISRKPFELRNYQKELVELAVEGKNVIISAPPGSGKTIVACHIIKKYLDTCAKKTPVLMFTPGGALAVQQCDRLKRQLPEHCKVEMMSGSVGASTFAETMQLDVIVLTPQILLNELNKSAESQIVKLDDFGLWIFDECHHCTKDHPYNAVMKKYFALKLEAKSGVAMPQVVGLSATLGISRASDLKMAVKMVKSLCANLNAVDGIVSVKQRIDELEQHTPAPDEVMYALSSRTQGELVSSIVSLMKEIEEMLPNIVGETSCPVLDGEQSNQQEVKQWCVNYKNDIAQKSSTKEKDDSRISHTCIDYIEQLLETLDFYSKCQSIDAVICLEDWLEKQNKTAFDKYLPQEKTIYNKATDLLAVLKKLVSTEKSANLNLKLIEEIIEWKFESDKNSKGMIMVEKRKYTHALKRWASSNDELKFFNAEVFTGTGNSTGEGDTALTHQQQKRIMDNFRKGKHKILICTPDSAGEGIDVEDCNFVIIYDIMTNEVTIKQITGRARKKGGEIYRLSSSRVARREHLNKYKTILMEKARTEVEKEIDENLKQYQNELLHLQDFQYRLELRKKSKATTKKCDDEFDIQCKKCSLHACSSRDIRAIELTHHFCIDPEFKKKYEIGNLKKKKKFEDMETINSVLCGGCGKEWGVQCLWKGVDTVALMQIKNFKLLRKGSSTGSCLTPKQWKDVPFEVSEPTEEILPSV